jgi:hypothetical protein
VILAHIRVNNEAFQKWLRVSRTRQRVISPYVTFISNSRAWTGSYQSELYNCRESGTDHLKRLSRYLVVSSGLGSNRDHMQINAPPITVRFKPRGDSSKHRQTSNRHKHTLCFFHCWSFKATIPLTQHQEPEVLNHICISPHQTWYSAPARMEHIHHIPRHLLIPLVDYYLFHSRMIIKQSALFHDHPLRSTPPSPSSPPLACGWV